MAHRAVTRSAGIAGTFLLGVGAQSCSLAFDLGREQCEEAADCSELGSGLTCENKVCVALSQAGGGGSGGGGGVDEPACGGPSDPIVSNAAYSNWTCLCGFQSPTPAAGEPVDYHYRIEKVLTAGEPPENLEVELCGILDQECLNPLPLDPPDAGGNVTFTLQSQDRAFLIIRAEDPMDPMQSVMPTRAFLPVPIVTDPPEVKIIRVVTNGEFQGLVASSGQTYDPTRGIVVMLPVDCQDQRAKDVSLATDASDDTTVPYYFKGALPNFLATMTDEQGAGGWVNLPVGLVSATALHAPTGTPIGSASFSSRPGTISYVPIGPTPGSLVP
jgi:hypothetical protein